MIKKPVLRLLALFVLFLSLYCFIVSAQDWKSFGNLYSPLWHENTGGSYGRFDSNVSNVTMNNGLVLTTPQITFAYQPLIWHFASSEGTTPISGYQNYLLLPNANYMQIYDYLGNLIQEVNIGRVAGQLDTMDFISGSSPSDVVGIFSKNGTTFSFNAYSYNTTLNSFNKTYEANITNNTAVYFSGIRHSGANAYFIKSSYNGTGYENNFTIVNATGGLSEIPLPYTPDLPSSPLAFTDVNGDGKNEFLFYTFSRLYLFNKDGSLILNFNQTTVNTQIRSARLIKPDGSSQWKLVVLSIASSYSAPNYIVSLTFNALKLDSSAYWTQTYSWTTATPSASDAVFNGQMAIDDSLDANHYSDIYFYGESNFPTGGAGTDNALYFVLRGSDGSQLYYHPMRNTGVTSSITPSLTLADMNHDGRNDFISAGGSRVLVFDPVGNQTLFNRNLSLTYSCVPADLDLNGFLDIICSSPTKTWMFYSNYTNQNPIINSVTYDPSTTIQVSTNLYVFPSATDPEGNSPLFYSVKCGNSFAWSAETTTPSLTCFYDTAGIYNNTVGVRDGYHSDYTIHSQAIVVSVSGSTCNNNGLCESSLGETQTNCPSDCGSVNATIIGSGGGGIAIPVDLVSTSDINQGLLPTIYAGTLLFLSNVLSPLMWVVFAILFTMVILMIVGIIKRIAHKVGGG